MSERTQLNIDVPPGLLRELKVEAARRGTTIKVLVVQAIESALRHGFGDGK